MSRRPRGLRPPPPAAIPMVITRYLYKPTASEGFSHFNDNRRLHIFTVEVATRQVRQLTSGDTDEHSIDWSPDGREILFASNHEPNQDEFFNYDIFALRVADNSTRRLTATESFEYAPRWSPDGKRIVYAGQPPGPYRSRDEHGRLACLGDGCGRKPSARTQRHDRQSPGRIRAGHRRATPSVSPCRSGVAFTWFACRCRHRERPGSR